MPTVSVIVPCKNEAGTILDTLARLDPFNWDVVFVEGGSSDDTWSVLRQAASFKYAGFRAIRQPGRGKADAVRCGFDHAWGDVLMILDGDLSISPEDLPKFLDHVKPGTLVIGSRMLEMNPEDNTMRLSNLLGNRFFARLISWVCRQRVADSLCGTKVIMREDWLKMKMLPHDAYGDFSLLFGAAENGMRIVNVPVVYHARQYGKTNIHRFRGGLSLLRVCLAAFWRIKIKHLDRKYRTV